MFNENSLKLQQGDQGIFNDKNVYTFQLPKVYLKYESSLRKDSSLDTKEFPMIIEVYKNPISVHLKIRLTDLGMTIENGDELLHLIQTIGANYPGIYMNIEENRKVAKNKWKTRWLHNFRKTCSISFKNFDCKFRWVLEDLG